MNTNLANGYNTLKSGSLWSSTGRCKGFAVANPGEAAQIDSYVNALVNGQSVSPPVLSTATGKGLVAMLAALYSASAPVSYKFVITGTPTAGQILKAAIQ